MSWICGMSAYYFCVWWMDNLYCGNYYEPTYCDDSGGDGGGGVGGCSVRGLLPRSSAERPVTGLVCGGSGGGGIGGGGGGNSNNQISDPTLHAKVDDAKGNAVGKLGSTQCQAMIRNNKNAAGISLWDVMSSYAADPATYISSQITFVKGDGVLDTPG